MFFFSFLLALFSLDLSFSHIIYLLLILLFSLSSFLLSYSFSHIPFSHLFLIFFILPLHYPLFSYPFPNLSLFSLRFYSPSVLFLPTLSLSPSSHFSSSPLSLLSSPHPPSSLCPSPLLFHPSFLVPLPPLLSSLLLSPPLRSPPLLSSPLFSSPLHSTHLFSFPTLLPFSPLPSPPLSSPPLSFLSPIMPIQKVFPCYLFYGNGRIQLCTR